MAQEQATVTVVGPTRSGKTAFFTTLAYKPRSDEAAQGESRVINPTISHDAKPTGHEQHNSNTTFGETFNSILRGGRNEGTMSQQDIEFIVGYTIPKTGRWSSETHNSINVCVTDAPGGTLANESLTVDDVTQQEQSELFKSIRDSRGIVICISMVDADLFSNNFHNMITTLLSVMKDYKANAQLTRISFVTICLTKYEHAFQDQGCYAYERALFIDDPDSLAPPEAFTEWLLTTSPSNKARAEIILQIINGVYEIDAEIDVCIFPTSAFGFIKSTGQANCYDFGEHSMLMTSATGKDDLNRLVSSRNNEVTLGDHFPHVLSDGAAKGLWHPFNQFPAFFHSVTGLHTGPLYIRGRDFRDQMMDMAATDENW